MRLINIWDRDDRVIYIDMDVKRPEPKQKGYLRQWMMSKVKRGKTFLLACGAITGISILTMVLKHI